MKKTLAVCAGIILGLGAFSNDARAALCVWVNPDRDTLALRRLV